ncbi:hypothetical protein ACFY05_33035 [Microtetraspora fusca]|uniref:Excinuclease ABC subunit A n=1 Tax=Microtetraspora fusca TaxID=1997 RepID=A0ABW6VE90_MICFU
MPKKGSRLPYRVAYQYPGQDQTRQPFALLGDAEVLAGMISRNDGTATLLEVDVDSPTRPEKTLAVFRPGVLHRMSLVNPDRPADSRLICSCGRRPEQDLAARDHLDRAGACPDCEGTGLVPEQAERDGGQPMAGNLVECPACSSTGRSDDVSYFDVDRNAYYTRIAALRLPRPRQEVR